MKLHPTQSIEHIWCGAPRWDVTTCSSGRLTAHPAHTSALTGDSVSLPHVPAINHSQSLLVSDGSTAFTSANHRNCCGASSTQFPHVLQKKKQEVGLNKSHNLMGRVEPRARIPPLAFDLLLVFKDSWVTKLSPWRGWRVTAANLMLPVKPSTEFKSPWEELCLFLLQHTEFFPCVYSPNSSSLCMCNWPLHWLFATLENYC